MTKKITLSIIGLLISILLITGIWLIRDYAYFYNYIGQKNLMNPTSNLILNLPNLGQSDKTINYLALGDSLTAGTGAELETQSYPYLIAQELQKNANVNLMNLGIPGAGAQNILQNELPQVQGFKPDIITLLIGINDMHDRVGLEKFKINLTATIKQLKNYQGAKIALINIPFLGTPKIIHFPFRYYYQNQTEKYNSLIKDLAAEHNLCLIDLHAKTKDLFSNNSDLYAADQFHPSAKGYELFYRIIYANTDCFPR
jgi:lysophospholipase L1-like esterase